MVQDDFCTYLIGLTTTHNVIATWGARLVKGKNLWIYDVPESPDELVALVPYQGRSPDIAIPKAYYPNMQIWIRSFTPKTAVSTGVYLIQDLHKNSDVTNGVVFAINSYPIILGNDDKGRYSCTVNFRINYISS
jgi:hypothetical protein